MTSFQKQFATSSTTYVINGRKYDSLDEVPSEFRRFFEDHDGDGRPDWLQDAVSGTQTLVVTESASVKTVNGPATAVADLPENVSPARPTETWPTQTQPVAEIPYSRREPVGDSRLRNASTIEGVLPLSVVLIAVLAAAAVGLLLYLGGIF